MPNQPNNSNVRNAVMEMGLINNQSSNSCRSSSPIQRLIPSSNPYENQSLGSDLPLSLFQNLASDSKQRWRIYFDIFNARMNALSGLFNDFTRGYMLGVMISKTFGFSSLETVELGNCNNDPSFISILDEEAVIFERLCYSGLSINDDQTCIRCRMQFSIQTNGSTPCHYHYERIQSTEKFSSACSYCKAPTLFDGCATRQHHIFDHIPLGISGLYLDFSLTRPALSILKNVYAPAIAVNCKMIYTSCGYEVARVSVVNFDLQVILDAYIEPSGNIFDLNTESTGIIMNNFTNARPLHEVTEWFLENLPSETFLIGHVLDECLIGLKLVHTNLIDTSYIICTEEKQNYAFYKPSLRYAADKYLGIEDQFSFSNEYENKECAIIVCKLGKYFMKKWYNCVYF